MRGTIYKDIFAVRFVRCLAPIPNGKSNAAGAGFTLVQAITRCQSELLEREFESAELWTRDIRPLGIAAHPAREKAVRNATQEAVEALCLRQVHKEARLQCRFNFKVTGFRLGVARTDRGYFAMIVGAVDGVPVGAHSAHSGFFGALLKAWEEYRSMKFFRPIPARLKLYTKANILFSATELQALSFDFRPRFIYQPPVHGRKTASAERGGRRIAYLFQEGSEK